METDNKATKQQLFSLHTLKQIVHRLIHGVLKKRLSLLYSLDSIEFRALNQSNRNVLASKMRDLARYVS